MVQMIGRGLRTIDPEEFPDIVKTDCVVLDFGTSVLTHGSLEDQVNLDDREKGEAPTKICVECESEIPMGAKVCPICGTEIVSESEEKRGTCSVYYDRIRSYANVAISLDRLVW